MSSIIYHIRTAGSQEVIFSGEFIEAWDYLMLNASRAGTKARDKQADKLAEKMNAAAIGLESGHETMWEGMERNGLFFITCSIKPTEQPKDNTMQPTFTLQPTFTVFVSASRATETDARNLIRNTQMVGTLRAKLGQIPMPCVGFYREEGQEAGSYEASYMLVGLTSDQVEWVSKMSSHYYDQDCILVVGEQTDKASLFFPNSFESIGKFTEVGVSEAIASTAFTQIGYKYFVCK